MLQVLHGQRVRAEADGPPRGPEQLAHGGLELAGRFVVVCERR